VEVLVLDAALRIVGGLVTGFGLLAGAVILFLLGSVPLGISVAAGSLLPGVLLLGQASVIEEQKRTNQILISLFDQYQAQIRTQNEAAAAATKG
jgi:hypothetical protein